MIGRDAAAAAEEEARELREGVTVRLRPPIVEVAAVLDVAAETTEVGDERNDETDELVEDKAAALASPLLLLLVVVAVVTRRLDGLGRYSGI